MSALSIDEILNNPDFMIKTLEALKEEREARAKAEAALKAVMPCLDFLNVILCSKFSITVGEAARLLNVGGYPMGSQRLFKRFEEWGWVSKQGRGVSKLPLQCSIERGYLELKYEPQSNPSFPPNKKTMVTPKGLQKIFEKLLQEREEAGQ